MEFVHFRAWLADLEHGTPPARAAVSAGLTLLERLARRLDAPRSHRDYEWLLALNPESAPIDVIVRAAAATPDPALDAARHAIEDVPDIHLQDALTSLLNTVTNPNRPGLPALVVYAGTLERAQEFPLAYEVYRLAMTFALREQGVWLVPEVFNRIGVCLHRQGQHREARDVYRRAVALAQEHCNGVAGLNIQVNIAELDIDEAHYETARARLDTVAGSAHEAGYAEPYAAARYAQGRLAILDGHPADAIVCLTDALMYECDPGRRADLEDELRRLKSA